MARRRTDQPDPINRRQQALEAQQAKLKQELDDLRKFQQKAPELKAQAQKREQQEIISLYRRPVRVEGPADYRYDFVPSKPAKQRVLRKERSKAPVLTVVLLVTFCCVMAYAVRTLWHG
jgi:hypothetical protein